MKKLNRSDARIEVQIDSAFSDRVVAESLARAASTTLRSQGVSEPVELTVVVVGDGSIRRLNREYRGIDAPTDVLAFGAEEEEGFVTAPGAPRYLGDVILSFDHAEPQARGAGHAVDSELQLLTVHGVLHLLGHDHAEPEPKMTMWKAQSEILRELKVPVANPTPEES